MSSRSSTEWLVPCLLCLFSILPAQAEAKTDREQDGFVGAVYIVTREKATLSY